jgi:hypothetical protein
MSTAVLPAPALVQQAKASKVIETTARSEDSRLADEHPFLVVGVFLAISLAAASAFVGSILFWLATRGSGVWGVTI